MIYKGKKIAEHRIKLLPVFHEQLERQNIKFVSDVKKYIDEDGLEYTVNQTFTYEKFEPFPNGLMFLATGQEFESAKLWHIFKNSTKIHFLILEKNE